MKRTDFGLSLTIKRTRKRETPAQMERVVPWAALVESVLPCAPEDNKGHLPFSVESMRRIRVPQRWFTFSDLAVGRHCTTCSCSKSLLVWAVTAECRTRARSCGFVTC